MTMLRAPLLALLCLIATCSRAEADSLATGAQEAYAKGDYARALALYDSIYAHETSASLLFNMANCRMKLGDVPHAVLYYERAARLQPGAEDIRANLDYARTQVVDRVNELPGFTLGSLWDRLRGGKDVDQWARRSLWACLLLFALATAFVFVRQRTWRRVLLGITAAAFLFTALAIGLAAYRVGEITDRSQAIIMQPKVDVHGEPREAATTVFVLHEGTKVNVLQEANGWFEIKLSSGSVGWVPLASLVII
jgi:tetratricopeptide (TPR) repeat protein